MWILILISVNPYEKYSLDPDNNSWGGRNRARRNAPEVATLVAECGLL
jgi:hypothetical protein